MSTYLDIQKIARESTDPERIEAERLSEERLIEARLQQRERERIAREIQAAYEAALGQLIVAREIPTAAKLAERMGIDLESAQAWLDEYLRVSIANQEERERERQQAGLMRRAESTMRRRNLPRLSERSNRTAGGEGWPCRIWMTTSSSATQTRLSGRCVRPKPNTQKPAKNTTTWLN